MNRGFGGILSGRVSVAMLCLLLFAVSSFGGDEVPKRLAVAHSGNWQTEIFAGNDTTEVVEFSTVECAGVSPCISWVIGPDCSLRTDYVPSGFGTVPSLPAAIALLNFDDGDTRQSYAVPPLGALIVDEPQTFRALANDGELVTTVNVFSDVSTTVDVDVLDKAGERIASERFHATPPVTQYAIETPLDVGSLRLRTRQLFGVTGPPKPLYGFVAVADRSGGNARVIPFE